MSSAPELSEVAVALKDGVATVTLNRPEQRNALSSAMLRDLLAAFQWAREERDARVIVLTGAGDRAFCAGADLGSFDAQVSELERHHGRRLFVELFTLMTQLGKPIVGRINGHALAGGFGLAVSCDLLVAADDASFGTPEVNVGVWPMMIQAVLARNIPRKLLLEMVMLGERWSAQRLHAAGVVNRVVPQPELDAAVDEYAQRLAGKSPAVMRLGKDSFYRQQDLAFEPALDYLQAQLSLVTLTEDAKEGVAAFFEKREPRWHGK